MSRKESKGNKIPQMNKPELIKLGSWSLVQLLKTLWTTSRQIELFPHLNVETFPKQRDN